MMKIVELLTKKSENIREQPPVTIGFLGDSVTQGCFECYPTGPKSLETVYDAKSAYGTRLKELLNLLYPNVQINIVNGGISGDGTAGGLKRIERDVLRYCPDLVVVSFGLNDSCVYGEERIGEYLDNLSGIFDKIRESGAECIFLTQNYMCDSTSPHLTDELFIGLSRRFAGIQKSGLLKKYYEEAKILCAQKDVRVCDLYSVWENMNRSGVNTTELLANKLNHPIREFHTYMAIKLMETMFEI